MKIGWALWRKLNPKYRTKTEAYNPSFNHFDFWQSTLKQCLSQEPILDVRHLCRVPVCYVKKVHALFHVWLPNLIFITHSYCPLVSQEPILDVRNLWRVPVCYVKKVFALFHVWLPNLIFIYTLVMPYCCWRKWENIPGPYLALPLYSGVWRVTSGWVLDNVGWSDVRYSESLPV
jgi:hypothetical protein